MLTPPGMPPVPSVSDDASRRPPGPTPAGVAATVSRRALLAGAGLVAARLSAPATGSATSDTALRPVGATWTGPGDASRIVMTSNGLRIMGKDPNTLAVKASAMLGISEVGVASAPWPTTLTYLTFANWGVAATGVTNPEYDGTGDLTVRATFSVNGGRTWRRVLFPGPTGWTADGVVLTPGATAIGRVDVATEGQEVLIRTFYRASAVGQRVPAGYRLGTGPINVPEIPYPPRACRRGLETDTRIEPLLDGGTIVTNIGNDYFFGPIAMASDGWDGRPVVLAVGDSVGVGPSGTSWIDLALAQDEPFPRTNWCSQGTRPANSDTYAPGRWFRRHQAIEAIRALDPGARVPFTVILSEMGVNSACTSTFNTKVMPAYWAFLTSLYQVPIHQTTLTPKPDVRADRNYSDEPAQTFTSTVDKRWVLNAALPTHVAAGRIAGWIDTTTVSDPRGRRVWASHADVTGSEQPFTIVDAGVSKGATLFLDAAPPRGVCPVLKLVAEDGTTTYRTLVDVKIAVVDPVAGGFRVTLTGATNGFATTIWPVGTTLRVAVVDDAVHPGNHMNRALAAPLLAYKQAGRLG